MQRFNSILLNIMNVKSRFAPKKINPKFNKYSELYKEVDIIKTIFKLQFITLLSIYQRQIILTGH